MESKKFCLGEHFTSYDDLNEKMKNYDEENFCERFNKRFTCN